MVSIVGSGDSHWYSSFFSYVLSNETLIVSTHTPRITKAGSTGAPMDRINASNSEHSKIFFPELFLITTRRFRLSRKVSRKALSSEFDWVLLFAVVFEVSMRIFPCFVMLTDHICERTIRIACRQKNHTTRSVCFAPNYGMVHTPIKGLKIYILGFWKIFINTPRDTYL